MAKAFMIGTVRGALTVKQLIRERQNEPQGPPKGRGTTWDSWTTPDGKLSLPGRKVTSGRAYLVVPTETIAGARLIHKTGRLELGTGMVKIFRRYGTEGAADWHEYQDGYNLKTNCVHDPYQKAAGETLDPVEIRVYNLCPEPIVPDIAEDCTSLEIPNCGGPVCFAVQDMWGDLYIVKVCDFPCSSSSSSVSVSSGEPSASQEGSGSGGVSTGSGTTTSGCVTCFDGVCVDDIPTALDADDISYFLGVDSSGCLKRVPASQCPTGSGS